MRVRYKHFRNNQPTAAFTLAEIVVALGITGLVFAGIINAYVNSARRAEWSGYSLAAQALSIQQLELIRAAKWDIQAQSAVDQTTNIPTLTWTNLDLPFSTNSAPVRATNFVSLSTITCQVAPLVIVKMMRVDTVWPFKSYGTNRLFTNTILTYRAPDQ